jgi:hypothetical protein
VKRGGILGEDMVSEEWWVGEGRDEQDGKRVRGDGELCMQFGAQ